jgi:hypothetical protein
MPAGEGAAGWTAIIFIPHLPIIEVTTGVITPNGDCFTRVIRFSVTSSVPSGVFWAKASIGAE